MTVPTTLSITNPNVNWATTTTYPSVEMTGHSNRKFKFKFSQSGKNVDVGWDWDNTDGAGFALRSAAGNPAGAFDIYARSADGTKHLIGTTAGALTWANRNVVTSTGSAAVGSSNVPVYVNANGQVAEANGTLTNNISGVAAKATAANLTTNSNGVAYYTNTTGTFGNIRAASGALYSTGQDVAPTFGTLPVAQGGTGVTSVSDIQAGKDDVGNSIVTTYLKRSGGYISGTFGQFDDQNGVIFATSPRPPLVGSTSIFEHQGADIYLNANTGILYLGKTTTSSINFLNGKASISSSGLSIDNINSSTGTLNLGPTSSTTSINMLDGLITLSPSGTTNLEITHRSSDFTISSNKSIVLNISNRKMTLNCKMYEEGNFATASGNYSHAEGYFTQANGGNSHAEGSETQANGPNSHAEGDYTKVNSYCSHAEGYMSLVEGEEAHAEGGATLGYDETTNDSITLTGSDVYYTYSNFTDTPVVGTELVYEGSDGLMFAFIIAVETSNSTIRTSTTLGELDEEIVFTHYSLDNENIIGSQAIGPLSHAEGAGSLTCGIGAHAEGMRTQAFGLTSHAEGYVSVASGNYAHAQGWGTIAARKSQHVFGEFNIADPNTSGFNQRGNYVEIVGNGSPTTRSNARTLDWDGNETLAGILTVGQYPSNDMEVTTKKYVDHYYYGKLKRIGNSVTDTMFVDSRNTYIELDLLRPGLMIFVTTDAGVVSGATKITVQNKGVTTQIPITHNYSGVIADDGSQSSITGASFMLLYIGTTYYFSPVTVKHTYNIM